jgi:TRAP-type C4-dicarboxylate transport system substrate-binding protein
MRVLWDKRVEDARTRLLAAGVEANEVDSKDAFVERMRPVWERFVVTGTQKRIVSEIEAMGEAGA